MVFEAVIQSRILLSFEIIALCYSFNIVGVLIILMLVSGIGGHFHQGT